jgi:hypothetical protein
MNVAVSYAFLVTLLLLASHQNGSQLIVPGLLRRHGTEFVLQLLLHFSRNSITLKSLQEEKEEEKSATKKFAKLRERTFSFSSTQSAGVDSTATYLPR